MMVAKVIRRDPEVVQPSTTLADAAAVMRRRGVGFLPVVKDGDVVGVLTDRDIVVRAVALGSDPILTKVRAVMSSPAVTCAASDDTDDVLTAMAQSGLRRMPVLDGGVLVGVASRDDLIALELDVETPMAIGSAQAGTHI